MHQGQHGQERCQCASSIQMVSAHGVCKLASNHLLEFACRGEDTCGRKLSSFSSNMFTHGSMTLRQHRSHGTRVVLLADFTNKVGAEDWTLGTLAFSSKHDDKGSQLPASEAIPVAFLWCPTESARSYQAGLITFIEQFRLPLLLH